MAQIFMRVTVRTPNCPAGDSFLRQRIKAAFAGEQRIRPCEPCDLSIRAECTRNATQTAEDESGLYLFSHSRAQVRAKRAPGVNSSRHVPVLKNPHRPRSTFFIRMEMGPAFAGMIVFS
jgi:hypothetical protein